MDYLVHLFTFIFCIVAVSEGKLYLRTMKTFDDNNLDETDESIERGRRLEERINLSFPGTKWCGPGNTASDYNQLGYYNETDKCCRDHDHCDAIGSGEEKYNLTNDDAFTRLHCRCDSEFKSCLRKTKNDISNKIGNMYFSVRDRCYREDYPIMECQTYEARFFLRRCVEYILDTSKPKVYQWFDLPFYGSKDDIQTRC